jgi:hypothetical protein
MNRRGKQTALTSDALPAQEIVEGHRRLEIPMSLEVLKAAETELRDEGMRLL